jgi:hypothetical protein
MAKLTEQEQQEIIRFLKAGEPLPDKYRFLLFDDKREAELVRQRAYFVTFTGGFEVLETHVADLGGMAYVYEPWAEKNLLEELHAIVILPSEVSFCLSDSETLSREGRTCVILHSWWISNP